MNDVVLTKRQERAMLAFLYRPGPQGFDTEACDAAVWEWGVRPWPTMDNLCKKGLIEKTEWWGPDAGWDYRLTDLGYDYMRSVVAASAARAEEPKS